MSYCSPRKRWNQYLGRCKRVAFILHATLRNAQQTRLPCPYAQTQGVRTSKTRSHVRDFGSTLVLGTPGHGHIGAQRQADVMRYRGE